MKLTNISIIINELDLLEILTYFFITKGILIEEIKINKAIAFKHISYKIFKNINLIINILKVKDNKITVEINKICFKKLCIPKSFLEIVMKFFPLKLTRVYEKGKFIFIVDLNEYIKNQNIDFKISKVKLCDGYIHIVAENIFVKSTTNKVKQKNKGGVFLKLTQTTLKLSGDDIMSFIKDFIKTDSFSISGIDISQAIYIKNILIGSFEVGDVSINIKDLKENLLYVQVKIINSVFPGVNIEHIPIKFFVKDLLRSFNNLNLDLDVNSVKFIDNCIEVRVNNFSIDVKQLSSGNTGRFLK